MWPAASLVLSYPRKAVRIENVWQMSCIMNLESIFRGPKVKQQGAYSLQRDKGGVTRAHTPWDSWVEKAGSAGICLPSSGPLNHVRERIYSRH